jgi:hypothetical protein
MDAAGLWKVLPKMPRELLVLVFAVEVLPPPGGRRPDRGPC